MFASKDVSISARSTYPVARSVRFRSSASAYLNRTPASASNRTTWTWSGWVKRGTLGVAQALFSGGQGGNRTYLFFDSSNNLEFHGNGNIWRVSTNVYRDPSAWYHIVWVLDTNNATAQNRTRIYINNVEITSWSTNTTISSGATFDINAADLQTIGKNSESGSTSYFDGYLAEVNFVDGQALTPSSFGAFNIYGVWQPAKYQGTYGTNGFYLDFKSYATAAALGTDSSGNGNTWTVNNISVTAGVTYDPMTDVPTLTSLAAANYATLNPLIRQYSSVDFASDGNLKYTVGSNGGATDTIIATIAMVSGKWYAEVYINAAVTSQWVGVSSNVIAEGLGTFAAGVRNPGYAYKVNTGNKCNNDNTGTAYAASSTTGDTIGIAMDADAGSITFYKNGTSLGVAFTGMTNSGNGWAFGCDSDPNGSFFWNFGQQGFKYTPPTGYAALNVYSLSAPSIPNGATQMAATTYTGNGVNSPNSLVISNAVNGTSFQPDFTWVKSRSLAQGHVLQDVVRGTSVFLESNTTTADQATGGGDVSSFNSGGFTLSYANARTNQSAATYVAWQWKANGTGVSNTSGSITSTVSVNTTAGFSIVTYTGTGANATVGHGLGVAPSMVIVKQRNTTRDWPVWHTSIANTQYLSLNATDAVQTAATQWNSTTPTSTVFSIGTSGGVNQSTGTYVAYVFAAVAGYSAFGSYTGNGSTDGPFVYTGFRPRFVMMKCSSNSTASTVWTIFDTSRSPYNASVNQLYANLSAAEDADSAGIDILSNGFKPKRNSEYANLSGWTYIYMCFAENPFKYSLAR